MHFSSLNIPVQHTTASSATLKIIVFAAVALLSLLLIPVPDNGFPYHYKEGEVWTYETLTAEWDFPLYKDEETVRREQQNALRSYAPCFRWTNDHQKNVPILSAKDMRQVEKGGYDHITVINGQVVYCRK